MGEEKIFKTKLKAVQFFCLLSLISQGCVNRFCFYLENQGLFLGLLYLGMYYYPELSVTHAENIKTNYILGM